MADLSYIQATQEVKIVGQDSTGNNANFVSADSVGSAGNGRLHTAVPDTTIATAALGALNANISIIMAGHISVGFQLNSGTLIGTIVPECSIDGGSTWINCLFFDISSSATYTSLIFSSSNILKVLSVLPIGGASHVRVRVSAFTSGTANALMRASQIIGNAGSPIVSTTAAFGTVSNTYPTVPGNTATLILAANPSRKYAAISNNSGSQMNFQLGNSTGLGTNSGYELPARSVYEFKGDNLWTGAIYAYSGGPVTISVIEGTP